MSDLRQYKRAKDGKFAAVHSLGAGAQREVKEFTSDLKEDPKKLALAAGAGLLAVKGGSYGRGAFRLRNLSPEKARNISETLRGMPDVDMPNIADPKEFLSFAARRGAGKAHSGKAVKSKLTPAEQKYVDELRVAADAWADTFAGMRRARRASDKFIAPQDLLQFNMRPKHQMLSRVVANSAPSNRVLYRGMAMSKFPDVGDVIDFKQSSWTTNKILTSNFATGVGQMKGRGGKIPVTFVLPKGERATNIQSVTGTRQNEWLTPPGKYVVTGFNKSGEPVMRRVDDVKKNYRYTSAFGIEH